MSTADNTRSHRGTLQPLVKNVIDCLTLCVNDQLCQAVDFKQPRDDVTSRDTITTGQLSVNTSSISVVTSSNVVLSSESHVNQSPTVEEVTSTNATVPRQVTSDESHYNAGNDQGCWIHQHSYDQSQTVANGWSQYGVIDRCLGRCRFTIRRCVKQRQGTKMATTRKQTTIV